MILKITILFLGAILAFWLSAICGGGASLILIPLLNLIIPTSVVPFSLTIGTFTSSASRILVFKKHVNWKIFFWFVPFSIPAVIFGAYLIKYIDPLYLQLIVGFILIVNVQQLFISKKEQQENEKPYPNWILAMVGFFAGFVSGITGAIGLLFNRFYLKYGLTKEEIVATRAANEVSLHFIKLIIYISLGLYSKLAILLGITIAVATIISSYTVQFILPFISEFLFKKIGYAAMVISGISLLTTTTTKVIQQDHIALFANQYDETTLKWRDSKLVLEFTIDEGFEIERPIKEDELPENLKAKYKILNKKYEKIYLEKVFTVTSSPSYEFYCFKDKKLTKLEFN